MYDTSNISGGTVNNVNGIYTNSIPHQVNQPKNYVEVSPLSPRCRFPHISTPVDRISPCLTGRELELVSTTCSLESFKSDKPTRQLVIHFSLNGGEFQSRSACPGDQR
ncbi:hypothetical protein FIBSPDRAFT_877467 [Athelia psychrophila]|uniref:Uncharacterized protein n=1 Tax=Athelia psychrophila TaxID=1759441 RepID=A0A167VZ20_9AGAM|nr:hypothetical protein FIBSPDRAFT_877467 [Fibularhizoctonia sp. CBS 109695]